MLDLLIYRDPRESARKCSLTPLRGRPGIRFVDYHHERRLATEPRVLLSPDAPLLSAADAGSELTGLLLIDCSWRRVDALRRTVDGALTPRRLPPLATAYPRCSKTFADPAAGLASVEALVAALWILGQPRLDLLDGYPFARRFLAANPGLFGGVGERAESVPGRGGRDGSA